MPQVHIVLEVLEPPSGTAELAGAEPRSFAGWLELMEAVEHLKALESRPAPGPAPGDRSPGPP